MFLSHYYYTELRIHEASTNTGIPSSSSPDLQRFTALNACLQSLKNWFEVFFHFPRSSFFSGLSFNFCSNFAHCLLSLQRLTALDEPAWDRTTVRNTIDMIAVCERIIGDVEYVMAHRAAPGDLMTNSLKALKSFRAMCRVELTSADETPEKMDVPGLSLDDMAGVVGSTDGMALFADDAWLADMFVNTQYLP